jgi:hypothetical protein
MRERQGLIADREGAMYMIEAIIGAVLLLSCMACLSSMPQGFARGSGDDSDLRVMSADLLCILEYRDNRPGHPGLAQALSTPGAWLEHSSPIESDISGLLPPDVRGCLVTPYGVTGDFPPDGAAMYVRPFLGWRMDTHEAISCKLIVWRG